MSESCLRITRYEIATEQKGGLRPMLIPQIILGRPWQVRGVQATGKLTNNGRLPDTHMNEVYSETCAWECETALMGYFGPFWLVLACGRRFWGAMRA